MASYVMEFSVKGPVAFLSHLELMKVFRQSFRRSILPICYSEGFNPHMKLSFAIAKGVGLESDGELLEIETDENIDGALFMDKINNVLPDGLKVVAIKEKTLSKKSLSALLKRARYFLQYKEDADVAACNQAIDEKLKKKEILLEVKSKKTSGIKDIKEFILIWEFKDAGVIIDVLAGSEKNLRIDYLLKYLDLDLKPVRMKLLGDDKEILEII